MKPAVITLLLSVSSFAQGPLTPSGAPTPTQRSLQEIWDKIGGLEAKTASLQASNSQLVAQLSIMMDGNSNIPWSYSTIDSAGIVGWHTCLAFAPDGQPSVAYYDETNYDLKFAKYNGTTWNITTVASLNGTGHEPSLVYAPDGQPAISFRDWSAQTLKYAKYNGTTWDTTTVDAAVGVGRYSSLCFNSSGSPEIAYYDTVNGDLKYAINLLGTWYPSVIDSAGDVGQFASMKIAPSGTRYIAYYDATNTNLKCAVFAQYNWVVSTIIHDDYPHRLQADYGRFCSLQIDPSGLPAIAYQDQSASIVKLVRYNGSTWNHTTEPAAPYSSFSNIGIRDISLAFSPGGVPVIAFGANVNSSGKLVVARFEKDFIYEDVDTRQNTGAYPSIRFGPDGLPAISYFNDTLGDLLMVRKVIFKP